MPEMPTPTDAEARNSAVPNNAGMQSESGADPDAGAAANDVRAVTAVAGPPRFAKAVTDLLEPKNWIIATMLAVGWGIDRWAGVGWGAVSALFAAVIPTIFIRYGMRSGRVSDRHVGVIAQRLIVLAFVLGSVGLGVLLMTLGGAPRDLIALTVSMFAALAAIAVITFRWKISVHAAVSAGSAAMLVLVYGPVALATLPLVALVGWSRVVLRDHTVAQVIAGAALGVAVGLLAFVAVR
jgi:membrane-associated phospholipid phosphatase